MSEWISVEKKLPMRNSFALSDKVVCLMHCEGSLKCVLGFYHKTAQTWVDLDLHPMQKITHWLSLPPFPVADIHFGPGP